MSGQRRNAYGLTLRRIETVGCAAFEALAALTLRNPQYRLETQHRLPTRMDAVDILQKLPVGVLPQQKYVWGIHLGDTLIGHIEVLRDWPAGHLFIGSMSIAENRQRQGHGRDALRLLALRTRAWGGIRHWRLSVVETQGGARAFWRAQGFVDGPFIRLPNYTSPLLTMEKPVFRKD